MSVSIRKGPGDEIEEKIVYRPGRVPADDTADIRDFLSAAIGKGYTSLSDDGIRADYMALRQLLGDDQARKVMTHAFIYNQNPATKKLPIEARIQQFYDAPAGDESVQGVLKRVKGLGYGVLPGFRTSSHHVNQVLAGRIPGDTEIPVEAVGEIKERMARKTE